MNRVHDEIKQQGAQLISHGWRTIRYLLPWLSQVVGLIAALWPNRARPYLGLLQFLFGSSIGSSCSESNWLGKRKLKKKNHDGRSRNWVCTDSTGAISLAVRLCHLQETLLDTHRALKVRPSLPALIRPLFPVCFCLGWGFPESQGF